MMSEHSTIEFLNKKTNLCITGARDEFSPYDAEDAHYIVEIKNRRAYYADKMLEAYKLFANYQQAQLKGKQFLYVVTDEKGVWVYNVSKHMESIIKTPPIPLQCPATTDFGRNTKLTKYVYTLPEGIATNLL